MQFFNNELSEWSKVTLPYLKEERIEGIDNKKVWLAGLHDPQ